MVVKRSDEGKSAGGWGALRSVSKRIVESKNPIAGTRALLNLNQPDGFDCPGCAWGDPEHGSSFEFCENGVKAVAWEATRDRADEAFFAKYSVSELSNWGDYELEKAGRLTHPLRYNAQKDHYEPIAWDAAFAEIGTALKALDNPNQAEFYTSGRTSNEAAFLYQTFVRLFGTNNFPDCSNMCHEASGVALNEAIGVGKGTVTLDDFEQADAIFVIGQNPGTNHPRMLSDLRKAAARGARVVAINPLKERGLKRFSDPKNAVEMLRIGSKPTTTDYFCPALGGDMALFRGVAKCVFEADEAQNGTVLDHEFLAAHTHGFEAYKRVVEATSWDEIESQSGLLRDDVEQIAQIYMAADSVIACWAMGITQHKHSVATIQEIANVMLLRGNVGRLGAGLCPVRGHSNVQGDRTVGINEKPKEAFLDAMEAEFGVGMPREHGHNVLDAFGAMLSGEARAFVGLGGNFARATPDSPLIAEAMRKLDLCVHVATKLNHTHLMVGKASYILPCLGRSEIDKNAAGERQLVSVEDSMSMVSGSAGINLPASQHLKSEVKIIAGIAKQTLGSDVVNWDELSEDNDAIRDVMARILPGFENFNVAVRERRGFHLKNSAAHRQWKTQSGLANFSSAKLREATEWQQSADNQNIFVLQTMRSHDQYNTTIYGMNDRYRGVSGERNIVFMHPKDIEMIGVEQGSLVDLFSLYDDGIERSACGYKLIGYDIPRGCLAGYYPELNVLVPYNSYGDRSFTPTSKSIQVRVQLSEANL